MLGFKKPIVPKQKTMKTRTITRALAALAALVLPISADTITYDFSDGHQGWTQIFPTEASGEDMWGGRYGDSEVLGSGYDPGETRFGRSLGVCRGAGGDGDDIESGILVSDDLDVAHDEAGTNTADRNVLILRQGRQVIQVERD